MEVSCSSMTGACEGCGKEANSSSWRLTSPASPSLCAQGTPRGTHSRLHFFEHTVSPHRWTFVYVGRPLLGYACHSHVDLAHHPFPHAFVLIPFPPGHILGLSSAQPCPSSPNTFCYCALNLLLTMTAMCYQSLKLLGGRELFKQKYKEQNKITKRAMCAWGIQYAKGKKMIHLHSTK